jgi:hypothetical protein
MQHSRNCWRHIRESRGVCGFPRFRQLVVTATSGTDYCSNNGTLPLTLSLGSKYRVADMAPSVDRYCARYVAQLTCHSNHYNVEHPTVRAFRSGV